MEPAALPAPAAAVDAPARFLYRQPIVSRSIFLAAWLGFAAAATATAGPVVFLPFAGGGPLRPDQVVEVRWRGVPRGAAEMELLLSLDGGRHYAIRVTDDLEADRGSYAWRVPPLASGDARLAVRVNLGGREVLGGVSSAFRIEDDHFTHRLSVRLHAGEIWATGVESVADEDGARDPRPLGLTPAAPERQLAPRLPQLTSLCPSRSSARPAAARTRLPLPRDTGREAAVHLAARLDTGRAPLLPPLRI
jgi:hypothetical protein